MEKRQRQVSFEWLRILAMCMIITLHYLSKGGFLASLTGALSVNNDIAWILEAFCLVAVNVYILISGYFGCQSRVRFGKVISLWLQVVSYSVIIGIIAIGIGIVSGEQLNLYTGLQLIFPIVTENYWFATAYVYLFLLMPFLNAGVEKIGQKDFQKILAGLLLVFCVAKTVLPMHLPWDKLGYDVLWFICLYLVGAYIRFYGFKVLTNMRRSALLYAVTSLLTFGVAFVLRIVYLKTGSLEEFVGYTYSYNHVFCFLGSLGLFGVFAHMKAENKPQDRKVITVSGCTFGVYLCHEHLFVRYLWPKWLGTEQIVDSVWFIPHMILSVLLVFCVGTIIEYGRQRIFRSLGIDKKIAK